MRRRSPPLANGMLHNKRNAQHNNAIIGGNQPEWNSLHHLAANDISTSANSKRPARYGGGGTPPTNKPSTPTNRPYSLSPQHGHQNRNPQQKPQGTNRYIEQNAKSSNPYDYDRKVQSKSSKNNANAMRQSTPKLNIPLSEVTPELKILFERHEALASKLAAKSKKHAEDKNSKCEKKNRQRAAEAALLFRIEQDLREREARHLKLKHETDNANECCARDDELAIALEKELNKK